ncbi:EF hand [Sphingomonas gellani]|uniref:EF hand n=1 Tax=Sphingomonas gellani TaxID=1166340 RepID=A0A1H8EV60_9SPHN|nr:hypothetical protein [Sphingomonas gellani]SEN22628.1 EF hand [Sphingomonas gellani]
MNRCLVAIALGVAATGTAATAQDAAPRGRGMSVMRADANGDGIVTRAEFQADVDARFARMDRNGDGVLGPDEGPRWGRGRGAEAGADAQAAPSPSMTRDQFRERAMRRFDRLDTNRDGRLEQAEIAAGQNQRGQSASAPQPPDY